MLLVSITISEAITPNINALIMVSVTMIIPVPEKLTRESPLKDVFLNIYQVRCNLFHGSKAMDTPRDIALVSTSANVLQRFLGRWLEKNGGLR